MSEARWYVIHTYSGYENKVKANIEKSIQNLQLEDQILEVRVPMQSVVEVKSAPADDDYDYDYDEGMDTKKKAKKSGQSKVVQKKLFPGYVLLHMIMNDETWYVVRNTRGVTGFVGPDSKPVPLTDFEVIQLGIENEDEEVSKERVETDYEIGEIVEVVSGAWKGNSGIIRSINVEKLTVKLGIEVFQRETAVEISMSDICKM